MKHRERIDWYNTLIKNDESNPELYNSRGKVYQDWDKHLLAIEDFNKAIELEPKYMEAYLNRGISSLERKEYYNARYDFRNCMNHKELSLLAHLNSGICLTKMGLNNYALPDFDRVIEIDSNYKEAYRQRALLYSSMGEEKKSDRDWNKYEEIRAEEKKDIINI